MPTDGRGALRRLAPAKVNLTLAVTGRRDDGYHLLDSLVVFAGVGDVVTVAPGRDLTLSVTGPMATGVPTDDRNLILRAAKALRHEARVEGEAAIALEKRLPNGGGIGGGSSDAAAALALLSELWYAAPLSDRVAVTLGADIPVCRVAPRPARMRGIGEVVESAPDLPGLWMVLAAPPIPLSTVSVFSAFEGMGRLFSDPSSLTGASDDLVTALAAGEWNDLAPVAYALEPSLRAVRDEMAEHAPAVGLSGSGATHWALHPNEPEAERQAKRLRAAHPDWWVAAGPVLGAEDTLDMPG